MAKSSISLKFPSSNFPVLFSQIHPTSELEWRFTLQLIDLNWLGRNDSRQNLSRLLHMLQKIFGVWQHLKQDEYPHRANFFQDTSLRVGFCWRAGSLIWATGYKVRQGGHPRFVEGPRGPSPTSDYRGHENGPLRWLRAADSWQVPFKCTGQILAREMRPVLRMQVQPNGKMLL